MLGRQQLLLPRSGSPIEACADLGERYVILLISMSGREGSAWPCGAPSDKGDAGQAIHEMGPAGQVLSSSLSLGGGRIFLGCFFPLSVRP